MMNKYIEIEMLPTACGIGGSFSTEASFWLDNFKAPFHSIEVKITELPIHKIFRHFPLS